MAYDEARGEVVLFGGYDYTTSNQTWTWNGSTWTLKSPALSPPPLRGAQMVYDKARQQVVLYGGETPDLSRQTWVWNGVTWTNMTPAAPAASPRSALSFAMAYDDAHSRVVLFGGFIVGPIMSTAIKKEKLLERPRTWKLEPS
jgi:hypothetical protein